MPRTAFCGTSASAGPLQSRQGGDIHGWRVNSSPLCPPSLAVARRSPPLVRFPYEAQSWQRCCTSARRVPGLRPLHAFGLHWFALGLVRERQQRLGPLSCSCATATASPVAAVAAAALAARPGAAAATAAAAAWARLRPGATPRQGARDVAGRRLASRQQCCRVGSSGQPASTTATCRPPSKQLQQRQRDSASLVAARASGAGGGGLQAWGPAAGAAR